MDWRHHDPRCGEVGHLVNASPEFWQRWLDGDETAQFEPEATAMIHDLRRYMDAVQPLVRGAA